jgi:anti-anti-sigma factor
MIQLTLLSDEPDLVHVRAEGPIGQLRSPTEGNTLDDFVGPTGFGRKVLLDMGQANYIDSSGISWLIVNHKRCQRAGGMLVLHSLVPRVRQTLHLCCMESVLHLADDEAAARALAPGGTGA